MFELQECHCEGGIIGGTTTQFPTTALKTGLWCTMSNTIKALDMPSSPPIGFEVKWHNSWSDN